MGLFNSDTYKVKLVCSNCGHKIKAAIKKGESVQDYLKKTICDNCGLKELSYEEESLEFKNFGKELIEG